jgi:hypothetical protein
MATGVVVWSQTAATNSGSDSNVNWAEGQAPSSVNNSARAVMASVAKWRDDLNGTLTTGGSSTAYTLTTNQTFASLVDGLEVSFKLNVTSGAAPTLNVDGLGAKLLRFDAGTVMPTGVLASGTIQRATYDLSDDMWIVQGGLPAASATTAGLIELATDAETATGTATNRALTPANLASMAGTYTPTLTDAVNVASSTPLVTRFLRIGDVVLVSGQCTVDTTAADASTELRITLPPAHPTTFSAAQQCSGIAASPTIKSEVASIQAFTSGGMNQAVMTWVTTSAASRAMTFEFTYEVI